LKSSVANGQEESGMRKDRSNTRLSRGARFAAVLIAVKLIAPQTLAAASLEGTVLNGTLGQPVAGVPVQLIRLQQGMMPVDSTTTDSQGTFRFDGIEAYGDAPLLLQASYEGATYSQPVTAPQAPQENLLIQVFEATNDRSAIALNEHAIFLRPAGTELMVIEQISVVNESDPPHTYVNPEGTYTFTLPGSPRDGVGASIEGAAGMPVPQSPIPLANANTFALTYPIRPGESAVRLQYVLDYQSPFSFSKPLNHPAEQTFVVTPGIGVQLSGTNLTAVGREPTTGFAAYQVSPGLSVLDFQVSGEAPATQAETQTAVPQESGGITVIPDAATGRRWLILSALGLILLGGLVYLYRA
jgi:hypothetical protein